MNFIQRLAALPHFIDGQPVSRGDFGFHLEASLHRLRELPRNPLVCLRDKNPLRFSIRYLLLLESGYIPILVPTEFTELQIKALRESQGASFWNEDELHVEIRMPADMPFHKNLIYGCLTSGTTENPKVSFHSVNGAIENARAHGESFGIREKHMLVQALPMSHAFGIVCYLWASLVHEAPLHFLTALLTPGNWNQFVWPNSITYLSPAIARLILKTQRTYNCPAVASVGGGIFYREEFLKLQNRFPAARIFGTYGFTEAGPRVSTAAVHEKMPNRYVGKPLPGVKVAVLMENGSLAAVGRGRLCVQSPSLQLNSKPSDVIDGFLVSNDEVELHEGGAIQYFDRVDDLIKVGGVSVYPSDILDLFKKIFPSREALVLKEGHAIYGEVPVLVVEGDKETSDVEEQLLPHLPPVQRPRKILSLEQFPRNRFGKVDRKTIRSLLR